MFGFLGPVSAFWFLNHMKFNSFPKLSPESFQKNKNKNKLSPESYVPKHYSMKGECNIMKIISALSAFVQHTR